MSGTKSAPSRAKIRRPPYEKAFVMMKADPVKNLDKARSLLEVAHAEGDARATYALGTWHLHGFHFKKNQRTGAAMIREAADRLVADAAFDAAVCYELGTGVAVNQSKALRYFVRALLLGHKPAAVEVERLLYWGEEGIRNRQLSKEFRLIQDHSGETGSQTNS